MNRQLPTGPLVAWYGDDFTGSAAVMEVLAFAGLPSVLFLNPPTPEELAEFSDVRGIGIAGIARSQSPEWMDCHLPTIFRTLDDLGAQLVHYKVCSTLDSSPAVGSIGRAADLAAKIWPGRNIPVLIAAPQIGRYQAFGNLFAVTGGTIYRLDRHPVMRDHPVTPMTEADVGLHLERQTAMRVRTIDLLDLRGPGGGDEALASADSDGHQLVTIDTVDGTDLAAAGRLIWSNRDGSPFVIGSQGIEYALVAHWRAVGALPEIAPPIRAGGVQQIAAVSGSVSAVTAAQVRWAGDNGFDLIRFPARSVLSGTETHAAVEAAVESAKGTLSSGRSALVYSALGPEDPAVPDFCAAASASGIGLGEANQRLGAALGMVLDRLLSETPLKRAVISGGDTSGHASNMLGVYALTALAPTVPGASICTAYSRRRQNFELALKGGQMGTPDYFGLIRQGGGTRGK